MALKNLEVRIGANTTGFQRGIRQVEGGISRLTSGLGGLAKAGLALAGVTVGLKAIGDSMKAYVGLESSMLRVNSLFGDASREITRFAQTTAKGLGMAESSAYQYAATFGNLFRGITRDSAENAKVTTAMLSSAAVIASKTGRTMDDVIDRIRSGLLGSNEAIEDLGINVLVSALEVTDAFKRIANGRSWEQLTFYEQQQIRTLAILEQAHESFGDEVQQGSAYSLSVLSGAFKDLQTTIGQFINAALQPLVGWLTEVVKWLTTTLKAVAAFMGLNMTIGNDSAAGAASDATTAQEELTDAINDTAKAQKKLAAGFDELNIIGLSKDAAEAASGGAGSGTSVFDLLPDIAFEESGSTQPNLEWLDALAGKVEPAKKALLNLNDSLIPLKDFSSQGLMDFNKGFLAPVGDWSLGEGFPRFIDIIAQTLSSIDFTAINNALNGLWAALAPFAINVGEGLLWFMEFVLSPLTLWTTNTIVPLFIGMLSDMIAYINDVIEIAKPHLLWFYSEFLSPIAEWTGGMIVKVLTDIWEGIKKLANQIKTLLTPAFELIKTVIKAVYEDVIDPVLLLISEAWNNMVKIISDLWDEYGERTFENIKASLETVKQLFEKLWDKLKPVFDKIIAELKNIWTDGLSPLLTRVGEFIGELVNGAMEVYNEFIAPIIGWFIENLYPAIADAIGWVIERLGNLITTITEVASGAIELWTGVTKFLTGVFTGDWEKAWEGVKGIVAGVWRQIAGIIEGIINGIITGINFMIRAMNKISFDVPDWVPLIGGESFGFNITEISKVTLPRLASGGVLTAPTAAVLGEYPGASTNPEIAAPQNIIYETVVAANGEIASVMLQIADRVIRAIEENRTDIHIGDDEIAQSAARGNSGYLRRTGRALI